MQIPVLNQATLKSLVHYDPETGIFTWLRREGNTKSARIWNGRFPGQQAGTITQPRGYVAIKISFDGKEKKYKAHRLAWLYVYGEWPPQEIDHINRVVDDNRICNLRLATRTQNVHNSSVRKNNKSGAPGVCWHKRVKQWRVEIRTHGIKRRLGYFKDFEAAKRAYEEASLLYAKEFSIFAPLDVGVPSHNFDIQMTMDYTV